MEILIIEDESRASNRIESMLLEIDSKTIILAKLESIAEAIDFLKSNTAELIISDIQLADGLCFEIFKETLPNCPIIFTTAYDQYAIEAFETNGIDYLLKPIEKERLKKALDKLERLKPSIDLNQLLTLAGKNLETRSYKSRFMIKVGDKIKSIAIDDVSLFYSLEKGTYLHTNQNRNYVIEYSLEQIIEMLNPNTFFKINRKYIISIDTPSEIISHSNSRLKLKIKGFENEEIIVARERVKDFKYWLDR